MTLSGLSYLASTLLYWWFAAFVAGTVVGLVTFKPEKGLGWLPWFAMLAVGGFIAYMQLLSGRAGLWFDMALLFVSVYFIGCCLGSFLRASVAKPVKVVEPRAVPPSGSIKPAAPFQPIGAAIPALETIKPYQWQAMRDGKELTLTGYVPSNEIKSRMMNAVKALLPKLSVIDRLQLGAGAPDNLETLAGAAFGHLAKLDKGVASLVDRMYTLTGTAALAANKAAVEKMSASLPAGYTLEKAEINLPKSDGQPMVVAMPVTGSPPATEPTLAPEQADKPVGIAGPRDGKGDDLKRIKGIGRQNEGRLHELGIWHFNQIAAWTSKEVAWVGHFLAFPGRIEREQWVAQAASLASGAESEFSKRVDQGLVASSADGTRTDLMAARSASTGVSASKRVSNGLDAPRSGKGDDLSLIKGVDETLAAHFNAAGLYHFDQIAQLSNDELGALAASLGAAGKALEDNWKGEAAILAVGGETDHSKAVKSSRGLLGDVVPKKSTKS